MVNLNKINTLHTHNQSHINDSAGEMPHRINRPVATSHVKVLKLLEYGWYAVISARMAEGEPDGGGYVQVPADCVNMCAESLGIAVTQDVIPALAEDVNYRVREATQVITR